MSSIKIKINLPFDTRKSLFDAEQSVLDRGGEVAVALIQQEWVGWMYGTQYNPPRKYLGRPGTSRDGWAFRPLEISGDDTRVGITIYNDAVVPKPTPATYKRGGKTRKYSTKGVGKKYAAYVHRSGKKVKKNSVKNREWVVMRIMLKKKWLPAITQALSEEIFKNLKNNHLRTELEANKASETDYLVIK